MGIDMQIEFRNKVDELGHKGKRMEGETLKEAGKILAQYVADNINRSKSYGGNYKHLEDNIIVGRVKTNSYGERGVEVGPAKELGYRLKFLEFGTSKMRAQAPMTKGVDESKGEIAQVLAEGMRRVFKS